MSNLSWGMQFRTCEKFWESADSSPALSQNFSQIQKPHRHYFDCLLHNFVILSRRRRISKRNLIRFCESQKLGENSEKNAESSHICHSKSFSCHSERSEESKKIRHCEILRETRRIVARVAQATRPHLQIHIKNNK